MSWRIEICIVKQVVSSLRVKYLREIFNEVAIFKEDLKDNLAGMSFG